MAGRACSFPGTRPALRGTRGGPGPRRPQPAAELTARGPAHLHRCFSAGLGSLRRQPAASSLPLCPRELLKARPWRGTPSLPRVWRGPPCRSRCLNLDTTALGRSSFHSFGVRGVEPGLTRPERSRRREAQGAGGGRGVRRARERPSWPQPGPEPPPHRQPCRLEPGSCHQGPSHRPCVPLQPPPGRGSPQNCTRGGPSAASAPARELWGAGEWLRPPDLGPGECVSTPSALVGSAAPLLLGIRLPLGVPRALMGVILNVQATRSRPQIHGGWGRGPSDFAVDSEIQREEKQPPRDFIKETAELSLERPRPRGDRAGPQAEVTAGWGVLRDKVAPRHCAPAPPRGDGDGDVVPCPPSPGAGAIFPAALQPCATPASRPPVLTAPGRAERPDQVP